MKNFAWILLLAGVVIAGIWLASGRKSERNGSLTILNAAGLTPLLEVAKPRVKEELGLELIIEASGSQVAIRKVTELGKNCDLFMLADAGLVASMLGGYTSWRLDFASDEIVLAVGSQAPYTDEAESKWAEVIARSDVRIGAVNPGQGPVGYRGLLVRKLHDMAFGTSLYADLDKHERVIVDHVTALTGLLKRGEVDYAFAYRSICLTQDIRHISLPPEVNLGSADHDYSKAEIRYTFERTGEDTVETVRGEPILWTLTIPDRGANRKSALRFIGWLLENRQLIESAGFRPLSPALLRGPSADVLSGLDSSLFKHAGGLK